MNEEQLVSRVLAQVTIPLEASGRHVHLSRGDVEALFGPGHCLVPEKALSQPGQFACRERVTLKGPKGEVKNVVVLGPERGESQVEISLTDGVTLGIRPPVRPSGSLEDTPGITLLHGPRRVALPRGLIAAQRHIHCTPEDAARFGVADGDEVELLCLTPRPLTFSQVEVRVSPQYATAGHLDYDEANACGLTPGGRGIIAGRGGG